MKVVFLENVIDFGGARKSTIELASNLSINNDVYIVDVHGTCQPFIDACNSSDVRLDILLKQDNQVILANSRNTLTQIMQYIKFFLVSVRARKKLKSLFDQITPDYVIINNTKVLPLLFKNKSTAKVVLFARGWFLPQQINKRDRYLYRKLVDRYCCVSEATRHALIASGLASLSNTFVVHNSINIEKLKEVVPAEILSKPGEVKILVSGGFLPTKGLHVAVEVAKLLKEKSFPFKMIITGIVYNSKASQTYYSYILKLIEDYNIADSIQLEVGRSSVIEYFKASDIFMHASDTEGLPRVVMEAMACRLPVVANAVGGVVDYVLDGFTGIITRHNNVEDYANAIITLYKEPSFRNRLVDNAYQLITTCYHSDQQIESFQRMLNV